MYGVSNPSYKNGKIIFSVSKKNSKVINILNNFKNILEVKDIGIKSVSDLICQIIVEKYDEFILSLEKEYNINKNKAAKEMSPVGQSDNISPIIAASQQKAAIEPTSTTASFSSTYLGTTNTEDIPSSMMDKKDICLDKRGTFIKRFLSKASSKQVKRFVINSNSVFPKINRYHYEKLHGKSVSEAYKSGKITIGEAADIYVSALSIYADMNNDEVVSRHIDFIRTKNDSKKKGKIAYLRNEILKLMGQYKSDEKLLEGLTPEFHKKCNILDEYDIIQA